MTALSKTLRTITTAHNIKPFTNRQIDTATEMLKTALNGKSRTIRIAAEAKIKAKYAKQLKTLTTEFSKKFKTIDESIKKDSNNCMYLHLNTNYGNTKIDCSLSSSYQQEKRFASTIPHFKKLLTKVEDMILRMKLGENLMEEVIALVNEINNIK